jgi:site-specific recombinase XerD
MKDNFADHLEKFFKHISYRRGLSKHTASAYSDSFLMLFRYLHESKGLKPNQITFQHLSKESISCFCDWIENTLGNAVTTRNQRLTAIHAFFRYIQSEDPAKLALCRDILSIRMKKHGVKPPKYLSMEAMKAILSAPDASSQTGIRDLAILCLLYDSAARVQELIELRVNDITIAKPSTVRVTGKGNKVRVIPILPETAKILEIYIKRYDLSTPDATLFTNRSGQGLTRVGVNYILNKYVAIVMGDSPELIPISVTPHIIRHTKASHLLAAGVNLIYIRDLLGHSSVITTEIYASTNPEFLHKAIENSSLKTAPPSTYAKNAKDLTDFLKSYRC